MYSILEFENQSQNLGLLMMFVNSEIFTLLWYYFNLTQPCSNLACEASKWEIGVVEEP